MIEIVNSGSIAMIPNAPFSQSIAAGDFVFLSGQVGSDPATGKIVEGGVQAQAEQAIKNLGAVLEANGLSYASAVKATCFLTDIKNFGAFNEVYSKYFTGKPARSCFAVKDLPMGADVEIELIAYRGK